MSSEDRQGSGARDVTELLRDWSDGDQEAGGRLLERTYDELRTIASQRLSRESSGVTLQPTELVHEAYMRLVDQRSVRWQNRSHFFALASKMMRRILVDRARSRLSSKRGGGRDDIPLEEVQNLLECSPRHLVTLDRALEELAAVDPEKVQIFEMRIFGGLAFEEIARHLKISTATLNRHWRIVKSWLYCYLFSEAEGPEKRGK